MLTVIQNFTPEDSRLRHLAQPAHAEFCEKRGYKYEVNEDTDGPLSKVKLLEKWSSAAAIGDEAIYISAESLIVRDEPLEGIARGRDLALVQYTAQQPFFTVHQHRWFGTDVIVARKRNDRLCEFFKSILASGPMGSRETLPVPAHGECGIFNHLLQGAGLNIEILSPDYCHTPLSLAQNPIIRSWRGLKISGAS